MDRRETRAQLSQIQTTEGWIEGRLRVVASALALPAPVRDGYLFDADHAFRTQCTESDTTLQRAAKRVFDHAGVRCDAVVVMWRAGIGQPRAERDGDSWFFELDPVWKGNDLALGAQLAREAGRALLVERGASQAATAHALDTELAALLAGLGALVLRAAEAGQPETVLRPRLVRYVFARVAASLRLGLPRALDVVPRKPAIVVLWPRVSRRPLAFAPLAPHVIIRCFCGRRLRVRTGAIGATTCPACKRKRPFDGRPCATTPVTTPTPLPATAVPAVTAWHRIWFGLVELPLAVRLICVLAVALVAVGVATTL